MPDRATPGHPASPTTTDLPTVPVQLRVHLAHATVQTIADEAHADILHIKGPATSQELRPTTRASVDADVLVRPSHLRRLQAGLKHHGWHQVTKLRSGGLVEHSTNWYHPELGQMDVHLRFPGIQTHAEQAFDHLWRHHREHPIAGHPCDVPDLTAQRLILLLHAARALASYAPDVRLAWDEATDAERTAVLTLATHLKAEVALAAATGRLEDFHDRPEYEMWRLHLEGTVTTAGFRRIRAEVRAVPDGISWPRLRVAWYVTHALVFMPRRLAGLTGRQPDRQEVRNAYRTFLRRGADLLSPRRRRR